MIQQVYIEIDLAENVHRGLLFGRIEYLSIYEIRSKKCTEEKGIFKTLRNTSSVLRSTFYHHESIKQF